MTDPLLRLAVQHVAQALEHAVGREVRVAEIVAEIELRHGADLLRQAPHLVRHLLEQHIARALGRAGRSSAYTAPEQLTLPGIPPPPRPTFRPSARQKQPKEARKPAPRLATIAPGVVKAASSGRLRGGGSDMQTDTLCGMALRDHELATSRLSMLIELAWVQADEAGEVYGALDPASQAAARALDLQASGIDMVAAVENEQRRAGGYVAHALSASGMSPQLRKVMRLLPSSATCDEAGMSELLTLAGITDTTERIGVKIEASACGILRK